MRLDDLHFPVFDDALAPPPKLSLGELLLRIRQFWAGLSPAQRAEQLRRDEEQRILIPFRLPDDDEDG
jgi:DNA-directed RNA polymerase specialized sigma24 family protein